MPRPMMLQSFRTGRLMALETRRFGRELAVGDTTNAVAADLAMAGLVLPDRAARRRGRLGRRTDRLVVEFFAATLALSALLDEPIAPRATGRRSALPWWCGTAAVAVVVAAHIALAVVAGHALAETAAVAGAVAVVVAGPALLAGRAITVADDRPDDLPPGSRYSTVLAVLLLVVACVVSGGIAAGQLGGWWAPVLAVLFGMLPAVAAAVEAAGAHPDDRAERHVLRRHRRERRAFRRSRRRWARALARWVRAHARLGAAIDAVTGPAVAARERANLRVRRHAARLGWRPAGHEAGLPSPLVLPAPPIPADELRIPLQMFDVFTPDTGRVQEAASWLRRDRYEVTNPDRDSTEDER